MPLIKIQTNVEVSCPGTLMEKTTNMIAEMTQKPVDFVMVSLEDKCKMSFKGKIDPCMYIEVKSLGLDEEKTTDYSKQVCEFFKAELEVPVDRIYIEFAKNPRHMWGWNNITMDKR